MRANGAIKFYMRSKGLALSYIWNLVLGDGNKTGKEQTKDAAIATADGVLVGFAITVTTGPAAPYVTATITAVDFIDGLTYDESKRLAREQKTIQYVDQAEAFHELARQASWFNSIGLYEVTRDQFRLAQSTMLPDAVHDGLKRFHPIEQINKHLSQAKVTNKSGLQEQSTTNRVKKSGSISKARSSQSGMFADTKPKRPEEQPAAKSTQEAITPH